MEDLYLLYDSAFQMKINLGVKKMRTREVQHLLKVNKVRVTMLGCELSRLTANSQL